LKEKHIQRWDLLSGISPRPVLILARVGRRAARFLHNTKAAGAICADESVVEQSGAREIGALDRRPIAHRALSSSATAALINLRNHGFYEKL
jgi:hypothetical protein